MGGTLYDTDILTWSEQQADLLRRLAAGERVNAAVDWGNLIDEVESVGSSQFNSCKSFLYQAVRHMLKLYLEPDPLSRRHWSDEVANFLDQAQTAFTPAMRQRIDLSTIYARVTRAYRKQVVFDRLPASCPYTLEDLLDPEYDIDTLLAKLG